MPVAVLTLFKLVLLVLLYLFLVRAVRAMVADLYGHRRKARSDAPRRPAVAEPQSKRSRKPPRELVVHPPEGRPEVIGLNGDSITLGRSSSMTVALDDVYVSDEHAIVAPDDDGGWSVRDLGSTNGTYLNGAKVTQATPISPGDQIRLGKTQVEVRR